MVLSEINWPVYVVECNRHMGFRGLTGFPGVGWISLGLWVEKEGTGRDAGVGVWGGFRLS